MAFRVFDYIDVDINGGVFVGCEGVEGVAGIEGKGVVLGVALGD